MWLVAKRVRRSDAALPVRRDVRPSPRAARHPLVAIHPLGPSFRNEQGGVTRGEFDDVALGAMRQVDPVHHLRQLHRESYRHSAVPAEQGAGATLNWHAVTLTKDRHARLACDFRPIPPRLCGSCKGDAEGDGGLVHGLACDSSGSRPPAASPLTNFSTPHGPQRVVCVRLS
jgi:hypothetical protein